MNKLAKTAVRNQFTTFHLRAWPINGVTLVSTKRFKQFTSQSRFILKGRVMLHECDS